MDSALSGQARAAYRAILRHLPRPASPLRQSVREAFSQPHPPAQLAARIEEAQQLAQYARAQKSYAALLLRYNPGLDDVTDAQRVRLSARRVGLDLPTGSR